MTFIKLALLFVGLLLMQWGHLCRAQSNSKAPGQDLLDCYEELERSTVKSLWTGPSGLIGKKIVVIKQLALREKWFLFGRQHILMIQLPAVVTKAKIRPTGSAGHISYKFDLSLDEDFKFGMNIKMSKGGESRGGHFRNSAENSDKKLQSDTAKKMRRMPTEPGHSVFELEIDTSENHGCGEKDSCTKLGAETFQKEFVSVFDSDMIQLLKSDIELRLKGIKNSNKCDLFLKKLTKK